MSFFDASATNLGVNAGLLITTGNVYSAPGPNTLAGMGTNNSLPGDTSAGTLVPGYTTFDASVVAFDMIPVVDTLRFKYVFASEEYPEFVGSAYNDVFGFFISGPNIAGEVNIATIPGSNTPVAINTVNTSQNAQYYVATGDSASIQYDAFTTPLDAVVPVMIDSVYHIKIVVADAGDGIYDSGVFLSIESLCGNGILLIRPSFSYTVSPNGRTVQFQNNSMYATSYKWDFGDGTTSADRSPSHTYATSATDYTVTLTGYNFSGSNSVTQKIIATSAAKDITEFASLAPNPTTGLLNITLRDASSAHLTVCDMIGKTLFSQEISAAQTIDFNAFGKGLFVLKLSSDGNTYITKVQNQ